MDYADSQMSSPSLSGTFASDDEDEAPAADEQDNEEYGDEAVLSSGGVKRSRKAVAGTKRARRKLTNAEGDEEYVAEPEAEEQHTLTTRSGSKVVQVSRLSYLIE